MPPDEMADMSVEDLLNFRNHIERVIAQRVEAEKKDLIARLEALRQLEADANSPPSKSRRRGEATPKYWIRRPARHGPDAARSRAGCAKRSKPGASKRIS